MSGVVVSWLLDAGIILMALALLLATTYAVMLIASPALALRVSGMLAQRVGPPGSRPLSFRTERFFYRRHRLMGGLLLLAVTLFFVFYLFDFPRDSLFSVMAARIGAAPAGILLDSLERFFLVANVFASMLAIIVIIRPSLLKPFETRLNTWVATRQSEPGAMDRLAEQRPRTVGFVILVGVIYVTIGLAVSVR